MHKIKPKNAVLILMFSLAAQGCATPGRSPASIVDISDGEVSVHSIYAEETAESLDPKRSPTRKATSNDFASGVVAVKAGPSTAEISKRTGLQARRARAVFLSHDLFIQAPGQEKDIVLDFFNDLKLAIRLKVPSGLNVNAGIHTGTIRGDPNSRAQIIVKDDLVSGTFFYQGHHYQIVADPALGVHYFIELLE